MESNDWALNPHQISRTPPSELNLEVTPLRDGWSYGVRLRTEAANAPIPDLGSRFNHAGSDADALTQDIVSSRDPFVSMPRSSALKLNWFSFQSPQLRMEITQSPSRAGLRLHHLPTGLRIETDRRMLSNATSVFVGVRLAENRHYEPSLGCSMNTGQTEGRHFCGFRLRLGL
jgi:hypothetical protein